VGIGENSRKPAETCRSSRVFQPPGEKPARKIKWHKRRFLIDFRIWKTAEICETALLSGKLCSHLENADIRHFA
jgi:hypothetical protein